MRSVKLKEIEEHKLKYLEEKRLKELQMMKERKRYLEEIEERARDQEKKILKYGFEGRKTPRSMQMYEKEK